VRSGSGTAEEPVTAGLDEAVRAAVWHERVQVGSVQYGFAHPLFRQALDADLSAAKRLRLHPLVARVLEEQDGPHDDEHAGELAEHFAQSDDADDLRKALACSQHAAAHAMAVYAPAEAARLLGHALTIQSGSAGRRAVAL